MEITGLPIQSAPYLQPSKELAGASALPKEDGDFGSMMGKMVDRVNGLQKTADLSIEDIVSGRSTDIHQVAVKVQEAGVAFDLMLGVRNRLMDCYKELVRMQP